MRGQAHQICAAGENIRSGPCKRLRSIDVEQRAGASAQGSDAIYGLHRPDLVVHRHARNKERALIDQSRELLRVDYATSRNRGKSKFEPPTLQLARRTEHRLVLDRAHYDAMALARPGPEAKECDVVRLRSARGEENLVGVCVNGIRDVAPRDLDGVRGGPTRGVVGRVRIGGKFEHRCLNRCRCFRVDRRRSLMVKIDHACPELCYWRLRPARTLASLTGGIVQLAIGGIVRSLLDRPDARVQVAGHETFPCRYGWLKKIYDAVREAQAVDLERVLAVFNPNHAIADFGVGKNMVASMRHWSIACGVLSASIRGGRTELLSTSAIGDLIFGGGDPYLEQPGSLWLLHWRLAAMPGRATTWYFGFNEFNDAIFTRDTLSARLMARLDELRESGRLPNSRIARATIDRDAECFVRTYVSRASKKGLAEDGLESPFAELGLVAALTGGALQFRRGPKPSLPDAVFAFALVEFWQTQFETRGTLSVETIAHEPGSPGRVFLMDEESLAERLERIGEATAGALAWDEGAGLRQVSARVDVAGIEPMRLLADLYPRFAEAA